MNVSRETKPRVQDYTKAQSIRRKRINTITDSGALFYALGTPDRDDEQIRPKKHLPRPSS